MKNIYRRFMGAAGVFFAFLIVSNGINFTFESNNQAIAVFLVVKAVFLVAAVTCLLLGVGIWSWMVFNQGKGEETDEEKASAPKRALAVFGLIAVSLTFLLMAASSETTRDRGETWSGVTR